ncbi:MAG: polyprenyl synthetase family protein, partial [Anaerolineae bacterium]|nr:polyprenyl synthetase family protein [Anaerolineae bacterium]
FLIEEFSNRQIPVLINGEITDVFYEKIDIDSLSEADLLAMSYNKTGSIFAFAGMIGAMIGLNRCDREHPYVVAVQEFASKTGMAFQLVDDVINIIGKADAIGKPVGSDILIGKRTIPIIYALHHASEPDRSVLRGVFGNPEAQADDLAEAIRIIQRAGGVDHTQKMAYDLASEALNQIEVLPESDYKQLIRLLGRRLVDRKT